MCTFGGTTEFGIHHTLLAVFAVVVRGAGKIFFRRGAWFYFKIIKSKGFGIYASPTVGNDFHGMAVASERVAGPVEKVQGVTANTGRATFMSVGFADFLIIYIYVRRTGVETLESPDLQLIKSCRQINDRSAPKIDIRSTGVS